MNSLCVFLGSSIGNDKSFSEAAKNLGKFLANKKVEIIYGGACIGLMGELANASLQAGGVVKGVLPQQFGSKGIVHEGLSKLYTVKSMHERKAMMYQMCEGAFILPGGVGTLDEMFEFVTWNQLQIHNKPVAVLNVGGYFDHLIQFLDHSFLRKFSNKNVFDHTKFSDSIQELWDFLSTGSK